MIYNAYEILGVSESATREEIETHYRELRKQLQNDRFLPGEEGEEASEKLQQLEVAYRDIMIELDEKQQQQQRSFTNDADYSAVHELISTNRLDEAQRLLDERVSRDAEWHYIQSILFYKRNWFLESKKQLELACEMEPHNTRYKQSLDKLTKILASNTISPDQMRTTSRPTDEAPRTNGGAACLGDCARCVICSSLCTCCMNRDGC